MLGLREPDKGLCGEQGDAQRPGGEADDAYKEHDEVDAALAVVPRKSLKAVRIWGP